MEVVGHPLQKLQDISREMKGVGHSDRGKNNKTRQRMEVTKRQYAGKIGTNMRQEGPGTTNNFRQNDKWPDYERTKTEETRI